jgi:hypothetical protein
MLDAYAAAQVLLLFDTDVRCLCCSAGAAADIDVRRLSAAAAQMTLLIDKCCHLPLRATTAGADRMSLMLSAEICRLRDAPWAKAAYWLAAVAAK